MTRPLRLSMAILLAACSDGDDELGAPARFPVPGCEAIDHAPCDVLARACQVRLLGLAACLRGSDAGELPAVSVISKDEFAARLAQSIAEDPPPDPNHWDPALAMLGLAQPGALNPSTMVAEAVELFLGYYTWATDELILIDQGQESSLEESSAVLLHEFLHALQDRDLDLEHYYEERATTTDSLLVVRSLTEGEAEQHGRRYWASLLGLDPARVDWKSHFQTGLERAEDDILFSASPFLVGRDAFPYAWGGRYMSFTWRAGGLDAVLERFASPPSSTRELMASVDDIASEPEPLEPWEPAEAPEGWTLYAADVFGAWNAFLFLTPSEGRISARDLALALRRDTIAVYAADSSDAAETAVLWRMEFADEAKAAAAARIPRSGLVGIQDGTVVTWSGSTGSTPFEPVP